MYAQLFDKYFSRIVVTAATLAILLAFAEGFANLFEFSLVDGRYSPGRLLEIAATLLIFVIVQLLRQIRDRMNARN